MPNAHYIDPAVFAEERDALLFGQWAGLAVAADVPEAGDAKPITFMGMPLLLLRDRNDQVRVFQNTCRHRGMILVEEPRKIEGAIRCPYHSWCYSTEGKLVSTPMSVDQVRTRIQMWIVDTGPYGNSQPHLARCCVGECGRTGPEFEVAMKPVMERWAEFERPCSRWC